MEVSDRKAPVLESIFAKVVALKPYKWLQRAASEAAKMIIGES